MLFRTCFHLLVVWKTIEGFHVPSLSVKRSAFAASTAENMASSTSVRTIVVDQSTLTLLEHININVPSHEYALPFYYDLLGCGMDPRKASNLLPNAPKKTIWANCGASQFHLPYGSVAQRIPGHIGLLYNSLDGLKERLKTHGKDCKEYKIGSDNGREFIRLVDHYDNVFYCRQDSLANRRAVEEQWIQPIISSANTDFPADLVQRFGRDRSECRGIDYVEFLCPVGTAERIALFYESVFDATTSVVESRDNPVAVVALGNIDEHGRADQSLLFRETSEPLPPYDGHHVAMYVGESVADFERALTNAITAGIVWVNPRFSDQAHDLAGARKWKQFRFKNIIDMETGETIFELEHEMRSIDHEAWPGTRLADE
ncbi:hypothetical protein FisN_41Hh001 [Fistulifera solaris]|uniref:VOC domain-containing protein n=1 Tax=Fistulifera solaris TaxID=1519565 RepID=A0A1Z5JU33_FISSO|nr:hypothetical protein FisN_41Hh001 [Fistulifera solaris]|eukprot:GAX17362.1 hypothetical protein FisN_41Hh001 [Fistulifera solaris]